MGAVVGLSLFLESNLTRPLPPESLRDPIRLPEMFVSAPEVWSWAQAAFLDRSSPLFNPEHAHLQAATVGVLWTNVPNSRQMRGIVGMAEVVDSKGGKWAKARFEQQLREWFGAARLDFVITLDSIFCTHASDADFCALVEHEMYHCGHARTEFGSPRFRRDGRPIFAIRGHDVEEFVGVVRRYGVGRKGSGVPELVEAANRTPEVAPASIAAMCGTCGTLR